MKFCTNCGKQLNDDAKFCDTCGAPVSGTQTPPIPGANENVADETKRKVTYVGVEKRCPWCNARISDSFAITCPECNRELSGRKVESSVKDFFNRLSDLSGGYESSDDRDKKDNFGMGRGWLFLLATIMFLFSTNPEEFLNMDSGSPLVIGGFILIFIGVIMRPPLTQEEQKKRNLIETFIVPNTKESVIEFLILACSQIQPGSNMFTKEGKKTALWNKVWKTKIRQTLTKSELVFMNDKNSQEQIKLIKKEYKIR